MTRSRDAARSLSRSRDPGRWRVRDRSACSPAVSTASSRDCVWSPKRSQECRGGSAKAIVGRLAGVRGRVFCVAAFREPGPQLFRVVPGAARPAMNATPHFSGLQKRPCSLGSSRSSDRRASADCCSRSLRSRHSPSPQKRQCDADGSRFLSKEASRETAGRRPRQRRRSRRRRLLALLTMRKSALLKAIASRTVTMPARVVVRRVRALAAGACRVRHR